MAKEEDAQTPEGRIRQGQFRLLFGGLCKTRFEGIGRGAENEMEK